MSEVHAASATERQIEDGALALGLPLDAEKVHKLGDFIDLLAKWNRVYNLTAIRDQTLVVSNHLLDSLATARYLQGIRGIDVGTGAGFPGIPIAIAMPQLQVTLLDSSQKRTAFVRQAAAQLGLNNVEVVCERVERWMAPASYDWVITRAFAELAHFARIAGRLLAPGGKLIAMKGAYPEEELTRLPQGYRVCEVIPLAVPGLHAQRHLVVVERA